MQCYVCCIHVSVSLHMQSVTDAAATQEPPSCELILSLLVIHALCAHFKLHMFISLPGVVRQGPKVAQ